MNNYKLSIIIPVYNVEKYLSRCLDSVLNQTYTNIEIICVNDGSTDKSVEILGEYASRDSRIKIINKNNEGLASARNTGLLNLTGEYVAFLDSDDALESDYCEKLISRMQKDNSEIAIAEMHYYYDDYIDKKAWVNFYNFKKQKEIITKIEDKQYLIYACSACNKIYRVNFIKNNNLKFPDGLFIEDVPFTFISTILANKISLVENCVYKYYRHGNSIMSKVGNKNSRVAFDILKVYDICEYNLEQLQIDNITKYKYKQILENFELFNIFGYAHCLENEEDSIKFFNAMKERFLKFCMKKNFFVEKKSKNIYLGVAKSNNIYEVDKYISKKSVSILQNIFSLQNSVDRTHKVITILGIKIKIKRSKK